MLDALLLSAAILCQSADVATTYRAMGRGYVEGNPAFHWANRQQIAAIKVSVNVGLLIWRDKATHPTVKRAIPTTLAVAGCGAALLNLHTMREDR